MNTRLRIQDAEGRGPWRPGFSAMWADLEKDDSMCPPVTLDFPQMFAQIAKARRDGLRYFGCCVAGVRGIHRWFTPLEIARLRALGFRLVDAEPLTPIGVSPSQILGASRLPLCLLPVVPWDAVQ